MLKVHIPSTELYVAKTNSFIEIKEKELTLEHSLISVSKWESVWHKPFLTIDKKSREETLDYIRQMCIGYQPTDAELLSIPQSEIVKVNNYISNPMTATTFHEYEKSNRGPHGGSQKITSELIYYWMIGYNIPFECEKWHLNRLLVLIKICSIKTGKQKPMSKNAIREQNRQLNDMRRKALNTSG